MLKGAITLKTPSNFQNNPKATPLDDTPTEAGIGGAYHLGEAALASPRDRHQEAVVLTGQH